MYLHIFLKKTIIIEDRQAYHLDLHFDSVCLLPCNTIWKQYLDDNYVDDSTFSEFIDPLQYGFIFKDDMQLLIFCKKKVCLRPICNKHDFLLCKKWAIYVCFDKGSFIPYVPQGNPLTSFPFFMVRIVFICITLRGSKLIIMRALVIIDVLIWIGFIWLVSNIYYTTDICSSTIVWIEIEIIPVTQ